MMARGISVLAVLVGGAAQAQDWSSVGAIFADNCVMCHSGEFAPLGLRLDAYADAVTGSDNGPVMMAGDVAASPLIGRIRGAIEPRMPMTGPPWLSDDQIAQVEAWVMAGMPEGVAVTVPDTATEPVRPVGEVWYSDIAPIILQRCVKCHSDASILGAPPEGLRLTDLPMVLAGGESIVVVPGNAPLSLFWRHVAGVEEPRMPFDGPPFLTDEEVTLIAAWIDGGARDATGQLQSARPGEFRVEGVLTDRNAIDGGAFVVTGGTRVDDGLAVGGVYELRASVAADGIVTAERLRAR